MMKPITLLFKPMLAILFVLMTVTAFSQEKQYQPAKKFPSSSTTSNLTYQVIPTYGNTFGYDIYVDGNLMIHQPCIPGMAGNEGFRTQLASQKVAELVIRKIKKGEMPPSVTLQEMKDLKSISF